MIKATFKITDVFSPEGSEKCDVTLEPVTDRDLAEGEVRVPSGSVLLGEVDKASLPEDWKIGAIASLSLEIIEAAPVASDEDKKDEGDSAVE